jgi:hypothetical protein
MDYFNEVPVLFIFSFYQKLFFSCTTLSLDGHKIVSIMTCYYTILDYAYITYTYETIRCFLSNGR